MPECQLMSKTYNQLEVLPGAERTIGLMELREKSHGFYMTALTTAMIAEHPLGAAQPMTLITEAESVRVIKAAGSAWVAGDWIYWNEAGDEFTNVPAADLYCIGKANRAATNGAVHGFMNFHDTYHPVRLGTSTVPVVLVAAQKQVDIHSTSAIVENVEPFVVSTVLTGAGATGGRARFNLATEVALGGWANALKAQIEFGTAGRVTGLGSAFCAELGMPATAPPGGHYTALEAEIRMPSGAGVGAGLSYMYCNVQGDDKATFQTDGYFAIIHNAGDNAAGFWYATNNGTTDGWLRIRVEAVDYYIMCSLVATEA